MMGRLNRDQGQLFYLFSLDEAVPIDHRVRQIDEVATGAKTATKIPEAR
jgi:hypothetical protein